MDRNDQRLKRNKSKNDSVTVPAKPVSTFAAGNMRLLVPVIWAEFAVVFALISITSLVQKSPTVDEPVHLLSGYANLKWADYRANPEHPPLAKMWAALPLVFMDVRDPRPTSPDWDQIPTASPRELHTVNFASRFVFEDNDAETLFFRAKLMMIALAMILGFYVFKWSRELYGLTGGLASLLFYAWDPNILAHSQIVHTDLPFTTFFFVATYFFCRSLNQLSGRNLVLTVLFFGLAVATKHAYAAILLIWILLGGLKLISAQPLELSIGTGKPMPVTRWWQKLTVLMGLFLCVLVVAYVLIWAVYGFRFDAIENAGLRLPMAEELPRDPTLRALVLWALEHRLFPEAWVYGQLHVYNNLSRDTYLFGNMMIGQGSWIYFPVAFAIKTPLPILLLILATIVFWFREGNWKRPELILLVPIMGYFLLAVASGINIGHRHILPIYPFLFVLIGGTTAMLWQARTKVKRWSVVLLCGWSLLTLVFIYPSYLTFFNELAGGPRNGHRILLDSNLDWGQDLKGLKRWMVHNSVQEIQFLYFGFFSAAAPRYYGIDGVFLPGSWVGGSDVSRERSRPIDYLAISANLLYGRFQGGADQGFVKPFRSVTPLATIGNSILVYNFDAAIKQYRDVVVNSVSAEPHFYLGNLLHHQGYWQEAVLEYRRAVRIAPDFAEAHNNLGAALFKLGALDEAIPHLRMALNLKPLDNRFETQFQLGAVFAQQGNLLEAARYFRESVKTRPEFVPAHYNLGIVSAAQGDMVQAVSHFRETLRLDPENAEGHVALARALAEQNKKDEASRHFQEAIRILKSAKQSNSGDQRDRDRP